MSIKYRVLQIEDSVADALFNVRQLQREGLEVVSERVETAAQMSAALSGQAWDFILCDYQLPRFDGLAALRVYQDSRLDIPFIVVSGWIGEAQAVKLIKAGAHEYVMKDNLIELAPAVRRELRAAEERLIRGRAQANDALLASIVRDCNDAIFGATLEGSVVSWNKGAERLYGYTASEIMGGPAAMLEARDQLPEQSGVLKRLKRGEPVTHFETVHLRKNRTTVEVSLTISPVKEPRGRVVGTSTIAQDLTRHRQRLAYPGIIPNPTSALTQAH